MSGDTGQYKEAHLGLPANVETSVECSVKFKGILMSPVSELWG